MLALVDRVESEAANLKDGHALRAIHQDAVLARQTIGLDRDRRIDGIQPHTKPLLMPSGEGRYER